MEVCAVGRDRNASVAERAPDVRKEPDDRCRGRFQSDRRVTAFTLFCRSRQRLIIEISTTHRRPRRFERFDERHVRGLSFIPSASCFSRRRCFESIVSSAASVERRTTPWEKRSKRGGPLGRIGAFLLLIRALVGKQHSRYVEGRVLLLAEPSLDTHSRISNWHRISNAEHFPVGAHCIASSSSSFQSSTAGFSFPRRLPVSGATPMDRSPRANGSRCLQIGSELGRCQKKPPRWGRAKW